MGNEIGGWLMSDRNKTKCHECGMHLRLGEYHPFAACLMYKGCGDAKTVRENLKAVQDNGIRLGRRFQRAEIRKAFGPL